MPWVASALGVIPIRRVQRYFSAYGAPLTGTVYHYPVRKSHHQENCIAVAPAPPEIAVQVHNRGTLPTMLARLQSGQSVQAVQDWAEDELEGFVR
jgi:hypothetical protein